MKRGLSHGFEPKGSVVRTAPSPAERSFARLEQPYRFMRQITGLQNLAGLGRQKFEAG